MFLDQIALLGKEDVIRYGVGRAVMKYCVACGEDGKGCPECRVYDFMQKSGVNTNENTGESHTEEITEEAK
jgi:hypothetical protein